MLWVTAKHLQRGDVVAYLDGAVWRCRANAEEAPYGWRTVADVVPGRTATVCYTNGTATTHSAAAKLLARRGGSPRKAQERQAERDAKAVTA